MSRLYSRRSGQLSKRPIADPTGLEVGEVGINYNNSDPGVYVRADNDSILKIGPIHVGTNPPNNSPSGQPGNSIGEGWFNPSNSELRIWEGSIWALIGGGGGGSSPPLTFDEQYFHDSNGDTGIAGDVNDRINPITILRNFYGDATIEATQFTMAKQFTAFMPISLGSVSTPYGDFLMRRDGVFSYSLPFQTPNITGTVMVYFNFENSDQSITGQALLRINIVGPIEQATTTTTSYS